MVKPSLLPSLAIVVGLSVGLTGCGDDSSSAASTTTVATLSAAALRTAADDICDDVQSKTEAVGQPETLEDLATMAPKILKISQAGVADLEALEPSKDDAATMTELIGLLEQSHDALGDLATAAEAGDEDAAGTASDAYSAAIEEFGAAASAADFTTCGEAGTEPETDDSAADDSAADDSATDDSATDDSATDGTSGDFADIDLGEKLNPIDGFTYETLPADARSAIADAMGSGPEVKDLVAAIGTTSVTSADGRSLLIFLGLNRTLSADEVTELVGGVTTGGTDVEQGTVAGETGYGYVSSDGQQGFVTVRADTVVIGLSDSADHLSAVIQGLFAANPDI